MISERISDDIPPQMKSLNTVIPILMHYDHFFLQRDIEKVLYDVGFATVYRRIYCRKFMTSSNQTSRCICKCIRMMFDYGTS